MAYQWNTILAPGETVQKDFTISLRFRQLVLAFVIVVSIFLCFQVLFVGVIVFLMGMLYWLFLTYARNYAFTDKRVILVESFLGKTVVSIDYNQITDIEIDQSFFAQLGGWGTLTFNTAGTHSPEIRLPLIDNPLALKQSLDQIRDKSK